MICRFEFVILSREFDLCLRLLVASAGTRTVVRGWWTFPLLALGWRGGGHVDDGRATGSSLLQSASVGNRLG